MGIDGRWARPILIASLAVFAAGLCSADDWPRWRGPNGDGVSREAGWSPARLVDTPDVAWRADVGMGHSAVVVAQGKVFTMGARKATAAGADVWEDVVSCLDAETGREIWSYTYPIDDKRWPGPGSTPLFENGRLYTISWQGHVHCFDASDGSVLWRRNIVEEKLCEIPEWGFSASPVIEGTRLLLNAGRSGIALDRRNGKVLWASEAEAGGLATPVLVDFEEARIALILARDTLFAVDPTSGEVLWSRKWSSYADPIIDGDTILLPSGRSSERGSLLLRMTQTEPEQVWFEKRNNGAFQSYVVIDGFAYGMRVNRRSELECIDLSTGKTKWSESLGEWGSVAGAGDHLLIIRGDGKLVISKANPTAYTEVASASIFSFEAFRSYPEGRPDTCWTMPVLANGRIYVRSTHGELACLDVRSGKGA